MQLSNSLARLSQAVGHTADLCDLLKSNLDAMRTLASSHAAQYARQCFVCLRPYRVARFTTVAAELNAEPEADPDASQSP